MKEKAWFLSRWAGEGIDFFRHLACTFGRRLSELLPRSRLNSCGSAQSAELDICTRLVTVTHGGSEYNCRHSICPAPCTSCRAAAYKSTDQRLQYSSSPRIPGHVVMAGPSWEPYFVRCRCSKSITVLQNFNSLQVRGRNYETNIKKKKGCWAEAKSRK